MKKIYFANHKANHVGMQKLEPFEIIPDEVSLSNKKLPSYIWSKSLYYVLKNGCFFRNVLGGGFGEKKGGVWGKTAGGFE